MFEFKCQQKHFHVAITKKIPKKSAPLTGAPPLGALYYRQGRHFHSAVKG
jgi:hypothetical protein